MAKVLYLLRHAKSSWDEPDLEDIERPLAPRGRKAARALAVHVDEEGITPSLVLCSPARRTRDTIDLVRSGLPPGTKVRVEERLYGASPSDVIKILRRLPDSVPSVMVVGHNPTMQELALALAGSGPDLEQVSERFPTGALAKLSLPVDRWHDVRAGTATLASFVTPKDL
jgi:phosphohistidine phosphatase